ncbi:MAG: GNAT family N-acetyltransferase [Bacteroides sp.]|jgi:ribosomal protein S18 acetylase RimI-like enzyme|nr:GNAT family N-acetyltransferase [Bacteroides sp.]
MDKIEIKQLTPSDLDALQAIARQTFYETFVFTNTEENLRKYLDESFSADKLTTELNDPNAVFYFARLDKKVIGYLKVNFGPSQTAFQDDKAVEIERIYVLAEFHGKKVGQMLLEKSLEIARQKKAETVWLGVWEHNHRAISFYRKNGFVEFDTHIFIVGDDPQTDLLMKRKVARGVEHGHGEG